MAKCLNCGRKLHLYNWKPNCPGCGVNLVYFRSNEILLDDSEKAEIEHAHFQPKVDRAKAAYFSSKLTVMRIVFTVLPVVSLLIPFIKASGASGSKSIGLIQLVQYIMKADFGAIINKVTSGDPAAISLALLLVAVVFFLVNLINIVTSLGKHGKGRTIALYGIMTGCGIASAIVLAAGGSIASLSEEFTSAKLFIGAFVYIALLIWIFALNFRICKKGIDVKYTTCLIGGLPKEEYFAYVEQGMTKEEIRRKMLVALTELQIKANEEREAAEAKAAAEKVKEVV